MTKKNCKDKEKFAMTKKNVQWQRKNCNDKEKFAMTKKNLQWQIKNCNDKEKFAMTKKKLQWQRKFAMTKKNLQWQIKICNDKEKFAMTKKNLQWQSKICNGYEKMHQRRYFLILWVLWKVFRHCNIKLHIVIILLNFNISFSGFNLIVFFRLFGP